VKKYYKVVDEHLCSAVATGKFKVKYSLDGWVEPEIGKLFCFDNLESAKGFANNDGLLKVFECKVKNPEKYEGFVLSIGFCYGIKRFWKNYFKKLKDWYVWGITRVPKGTILCDSIKLVKEVVNEDY